MKKILWVSLLLGCSLYTSAVFATACHFTITLNSIWDNFKDWTIIITDVSGDSIYEAVGGPQLVYDGKAKKQGFKLYATVNDCSNKTQVGFFGHKYLTNYSTNNLSSNQITEETSSDPQFHIMGGASNVLTGISKCVGDVQKTPKNNGVDIELILGNPDNPGDFFFGGISSRGANKWTKTDLQAVCNTPGGPL